MILYKNYFNYWITIKYISLLYILILILLVIDKKDIPCRVGSVGSVSASRAVGREFASRPGHTKDHHKNGTNCLPAQACMR